jgi:hypothetical protein
MSSSSPPLGWPVAIVHAFVAPNECWYRYGHLPELRRRHYEYTSLPTPPANVAKSCRLVKGILLYELVDRRRATAAEKLPCSVCGHPTATDSNNIFTRDSDGTVLCGVWCSSECGSYAWDVFEHPTVRKRRIAAENEMRF